MITCHLRTLMTDRGVGYKKLAHETGLPKSVLLTMAQGHTIQYHAHTIDKLCAYFGVQPGDLLVWQPGPQARTLSELHLAGAT